MKENIFKNIPVDIPDELLESIIESESVKIERIISKGHKSPEGYWYDQDKNEWIIVLKGKASLRFENSDSIKLSEGDYINIPAHQKHRVDWTNPDEETVWLAVFY